MKKKKSSVYSNTLLLISAVIVVLAVAELVLREFKPIKYADFLEVYEYDKDLGYRLRSGIHIYNTTDYQQETKTNETGATNFQEHFEEYDSLIFTVGDSFTHGSGLPSDMNYPFQLDLTLNHNDEGFYSKRFAIVNLGVPSFGGEQSLIRLKKFAKLIGEPSIVLYLGADNDYSDDILFRSGYKHKNIVTNSPHWGWMVRPLQWLINNSQIANRIRIIVFKKRQSAILDQRVYVQDMIASQEEERKDMVNVAEQERDVLNQLVSICGEFNAVLVVTWIGTSPSYDWLKLWAGKNGVAFADWVPKVKLIQSSMPNLPHRNHHSAGHYRAWVNRIIAEEFARQIEARQK